MSAKLIRLKRLIDLVHVLNVSPLPLIHHYTLESMHIYFVPVNLGGEPSVIYYYESPQPLQGVYILFNNFSGEIILSNKWVSDSKFLIIPIVEVEAQSFFSPKEFLQEVRKNNLKNREKDKHAKVATTEELLVTQP
ncbi:MAG: hypothetical protein ACP5II_00240 [Infirmifilum sp.]|jgi:hypothetical protein|uniref:Uncharacterized protein n=1 Tax=Infirmifilum uzonense TaxID=1550241 RepID=A0A0F7FG44_9CREN|nr:hypothetical protein [Infirmifilum uzonense]AKG38042.1 hypothetical protein MA03_00305 [Infirmifilum uzonense]